MDPVVKDAHARFESRMKLRIQLVSCNDDAVDFCIRVGVKLSALASDKKEIQQRVYKHIVSNKLYFFCVQY